MKCPSCGARKGKCPECGKEYEHGAASKCLEPGCLRVNAPIDCFCGLVVSDDGAGVVTQDMTFMPFERD